MNDRSPDLLKPTLIAGVLFGTLASLPFVRLLNCLCCALLLGCGVFAAYIYSEACRRQGTPFRAGNGALVGLIAGAFYAVTTTLVSALVSMAGLDMDARALFEFIKNLPNVPAEQRDLIDEALEDSGTFSVGKTILGFFISVLLGAVFSTLGGLIGGAVFKVEPVPPAPPAPPPPPGSDTI
jgi:hypothetical protein